MRRARRAEARLVVVGVALALLGAAPDARAQAGCDHRAQPGTLDSALGAAKAGQTICLQAGEYGTFTGTDKKVTLKAAPGTDARMGFSLGEGDRDFTLDGLTFHEREGGDRFSAIVGDVRNVTFRNSRFTVPTYIDGPIESGILFDRNRFVGINELPGDIIDSGLDLRYGPQCTRERRSGITVRNSLFADGSFTAIKTGCGMDIVGNTFRDVCENLELSPDGHTDNIQLNGASGTVVRGNFFTHEGGVGKRCEAGVIAGYDGTDRLLIEDNVIIGVNRPASIELNSDDGSIVRHNTLEATGRKCSGGARCGQIAIGSKRGSSTFEAGNDVGRGTQIYNNIAWSVNVDKPDATVARNDHNMVREDVRGTGNFRGAPRFVDPKGDRRASFLLAKGSEGRGRASNGRDVGARRSWKPAVVTPADTGGVGRRELLLAALALVAVGLLLLLARHAVRSHSHHPKRPRPL